jgi:hypothetical protein
MGLYRGHYLGTVFTERFLVRDDLIDDAISFHAGLPKIVAQWLREKESARPGSERTSG